MFGLAGDLARPITSWGPRGCFFGASRADPMGITHIHSSFHHFLKDRIVSSVYLPFQGLHTPVVILHRHMKRHLVCDRAHAMLIKPLYEDDSYNIFTLNF